MRTLVTGATGFVGRHLLPHLEEPVVLSRSAAKGLRLSDERQVTVFPWSPLEQPPPPAALEGVDVVVHLAGESIATGRWTAAKKARIEASRVVGTRHLVEGLLAARHPPRALISASAVGYYGSRGDEVLDEQSTAGSDFLGSVCTRWEASAQAAAEAGVRVALLRVGLVLGAGGGALAAMLTPFKLGLGGRLGSGRQWMSLISLEDLVRLIVFVCEHPTLVGAVNATSPQPCTNVEFTSALGQLLHRPTLLAMPEPLLRLALGEFAEVLLASQRVVPAVACRAGFQFLQPDIKSALEHALEH